MRAASALLIGLLACRAVAVDQAPVTAPATTQAVRISDEAARLIEKMRLAHAGVKAATLKGTLTATFDVAGRKQTYRADLDTLFSADGRFRHELVGYGVVIGDGASVTFYDPRRNTFGTTKQKTPVGPWANVFSPIADVLSDENPLLLLLMVTDPRAALADNAESIEATTVEDQPALKIEGRSSVRWIVLDPQSGFARVVRTDLAREFAERGAPNATAWIEVRYEPIVERALPSEKDFAFTPPPAATEFILPARPAGDEELLRSDDPASTRPSQDGR